MPDAKANVKLGNEKVQLVSCCPDFKSKQPVAFGCGELFPFGYQRLNYVGDINSDGPLL